MHRTILNIGFYLCLVAVPVSTLHSYINPFIFSFLAVGIYFILNPLAYPFEGQENESALFLPDSPNPKTDFLFAMELAGPKKSFFDSDWDASWLTFLEHRIPHFHTGGRADLESLEDSSYRTIMVAGKGWGEFPRELHEKLERFVARGGKLILSRPYAGLGNFYQGCTVPYIRDFSELYNSICENQDALGLFSNKNVYTIGFDYGLLSMVLRQGMPQNSFFVRKKSKIKIRQKNSFDLCMDHPHTPYPWLDRLDDSLAGKLGLPDPKIGKKIILTHDEDYYGATLADIVTREHSEFKIPSVNFIVADSKIAKGELDRIIKTGSEIGIHWNCFRFHLDKTGAHYNPYPSLKTQIESLKRKLPQDYVVTSNRNHWLKWGHSYTLPLEILSASGIGVDATFGAWLDKEGPLYGTLRPYRALSQDGKPLALLEMPTLLYDNVDWLSNHFSSDVLQRACWLNVLFHPNIAQKKMNLQKPSSYQLLLQLLDKGFSFTTFSKEMTQWKKPVVC